MSSSLILPLTILTVLSFLSLAIGHRAQPCSEEFLKLAQQKNLSDCKTLRTLGAEFAWSYHSVTNKSIELEIMFRATLPTPQGWMAWGVNPGKRPEMIGTKAIIAIKRSDGTWGMDTHTTSPRRPENACSPLPSKIAFVTNKSVANMNTMNARILVLPSDVYKLSWVCN